MASNVIRVSLLADASKMKSGLKDADKAVATTEKGMTGFGKAAVAGFGVVAASAVVGFATDAVKAFSDVEQSAGSVEAVFGESADSIKEQAAGAAEEFGLSASSFQTSAALIGSMLKNQMGLSAEEAAEKVDDLTGKAADMAATFGGTTSEAIAAIGSLMRGERDPIEKYGVSMNDASISAHALEQGLVDSTSEMTPQIKATAALDLLYEQTADSAGQFAEESDTLAGKQQILAAEFENAKAALGEQLAPVVSEAMGLLTDFVTKTVAAEDAWQDFGTTVQEGADDFWEALGKDKMQDTILAEEAPLDAWIKGLLGIGPSAAEAVGGMEDARTHGVEPLTEAIDDQTTAEGDLAGAIRDTITARQEAFDQVQSQLDPFFAYTDAVDDQAAAQQAVNDAVEEFGEGSPEHIEALKDKAGATRDVEAAELELLAAGGLTREEFERQRVKMGLTADEAQILIDKYNILFTPRSVSHNIVFRESTRKAGHTYAGTQHGGEVAAGVPRIVGEAGRELFVPDTNGRIVPHGSFGARTASPSYNITINAGMGSDPNAISKAVVEALQRYQRANGPLPVTVRSA